MTSKLYAAFLLVFYCGLISLPANAAGGNGQPRAKEGVLDLRNQAFSSEIELGGEWEFFWGRLLRPDEFSQKGTLINFPFLWSGSTVNGKKLPSFGFATYKLKILLKPSVQPLQLALPDCYTAYRLFINGAEAAANGRVSTGASGFIPQWQYRTVDIPKGTQTLEILLQISNFAHSKGGIKKPLVIGRKAVVELNRHRTDAIDLLLTGCLFMGGLFFLGLYILGKRDKAIFFFSLFCMAFSYRTLGTDNYVLHTILPQLNWYLTVRLEYISLFLGIGLFGLYTMYLYPDDISKRIVLIIGGICLAFSLGALLLNPYYFTQLINPFLLVTIFCLIYIPYVYLKAYRLNRPGSIYALSSSVALMCVFAISLLHYWGWIPALQLITFFGFISFFFLQSLVLSHRVSFALTQAAKEAEQGLIAKSEFLSTMSHEIRTPLNSVIGMSHLLLKSDPRPDQVEQLDVMLFSANNLLAIVNDILDYNKIEAGKISFEDIEMDIVSIARNIVTGLQNSATDKGIKLDLEIDEAIRNKVFGDPTRCYQVITNLVHNAIKFTKEGFVKLRIDVEGQTESDITLKVSVSDTGIGISAEKQKIIFDRFTQADSSTSRGFGGTGLGLSICKRILELQHSSLQVESEEGKGSTFYFVKSFDKGQEAGRQKSSQIDMPKGEDKPFSGIHILLVEDNPMNVLVAQSFLKRWGAEVDVAVNGAEALEKLDITKHRLVLMDLHMPVMDGYEASKKMRERGVVIPIVALTANLPKEIEEQLKGTGINDVVVKPFLPDELFRKVLLQISPAAGKLQDIS